MAGRLRGDAATQSSSGGRDSGRGCPGTKQTGQCETRFRPLIAAGATAYLANDHQWTEGRGPPDCCQLVDWVRAQTGTTHLDARRLHKL